MPSYEYNLQHKAFIKQCSCCKEITVGSDNLEESLKIFEDVFAPAGPSSGMADGMQSRCWMCNTRSRRELGVTRNQLEEMWKKQNGKCAICELEISIKRRAGVDVHAHVDHNNNTGNIRELLCGNCNRGIGIFKHNPKLLTQAANYVRKHEPQSDVIPLRRRV